MLIGQKIRHLPTGTIYEYHGIAGNGNVLAYDPNKRRRKQLRASECRAVNGPAAGTLPPKGRWSVGQRVTVRVRGESYTLRGVVVGNDGRAIVRIDEDTSTPLGKVWHGCEMRDGKQCDLVREAQEA